MTRKANNFYSCPKCGELLKCPKCGEPLTEGTPFSHYLRNLPHPYDSSTYDIENLDYIINNYKKGWLMTVEEKRFDGYPKVSQVDTHYIVEQMFAQGSGCSCETLRGTRPYEFRGHYLVRFEKSGPLDSDWVEIGKNSINNSDPYFYYTDVDKAIKEIIQTGNLPLNGKRRKPRPKDI